MNLLPGLNWLVSWAAKRASRRESPPDPGDMGTAFGLDASLALDGREPVAAPKPTTPMADRVARRPRR